MKTKQKTAAELQRGDRYLGYTRRPDEYAAQGGREIATVKKAGQTMRYTFVDQQPGETHMLPTYATVFVIEV